MLLECIMKKELKLSFILFFVFAAILLAFKTLTTFFGGVAINYVALLGITLAILLIGLKDKSTLKRIKDLFIVACVFCGLELIIYLACEFGDGETLSGFSIYQNIISALGIFYFIYISIRFALEFTNTKIKFIEIMLGEEKRQPKAKKAKELSNGSLLDKPNNKNNTIKSEDENVENEETEIIIETEDEE